MSLFSIKKTGIDDTTPEHGKKKETPLLLSHWLPSLAFSLCLSSPFFLSADDLESRLSSLESRMSAARVRTEKGTIGAKMATARPLTDGYGFFVRGDFLCWHLQEGGTDTVIKSKEPTSVPVRGHSKHAHFNWDFGFRIGGGYLLEHDGWDSQFCFTWFQTDAHEKTTASKHGLLFPEIGMPFVEIGGTFQPGTKAKTHWEIGYYVFDLELARSFFLSKFFSLRPLFGMETAWIHQHMHFRESLVPGFDQTRHKVKGKSDFWGIGPLIGFDTTWFFSPHFSLFGNVRGAILWAEFDVKDKQKFSGSSPIKLTDTDADFHALAPNVKMILGGQWENNFNEDANHFSIKLGYEFQYWWNQNQFLEVNSTFLPIYERKSEALSINGVTLELRLDF